MKNISQQRSDSDFWMSQWSVPLLYGKKETNAETNHFTLNVPQFTQSIHVCCFTGNFDKFKAFLPTNAIFIKT
jgi:hypothetical protein